MTRARPFILAVAFVLFLGEATEFARAACTNPVGNEGESIYSNNYHVPMYCNGSTWIPYGSSDPAAGGGSCTNPAGSERDIKYSATYHAYIYCDGTQWRKAQGSCASLPRSRGSGYFVLTQSTYDGNLGGLAGGNAKCLTELTTNTNWKGYSDASNRGLLASGKVRAFLCNNNGSTGCINPLPDTKYIFATVGDATAGGGSFTADANGAGPGDSANWSGASYFNGNYAFWSGRIDNLNHNTSTMWYTGMENGANCTHWKSASGVTGSTGITANTNNYRWGSFPSSDCALSFRLVCMVDP